MDQVGGPTRHVSTLGNSVKVYERQVALHDLSEADIVRVVGVRAPVPVSEQSSFVKSVVVGARAAMHNGSRGDR
jgi:hypothetical protein